MKFARSGLLGSRRLDALDYFLDRRAVANIDHLVGIGDAEIDSIAGLQLVAENFLSVYKSAVAAAHILQHEFAIDRQYLRLVAADSAVAQGQLVSGLPADPKRRGGHHHIAAHAVGFDDDESLAGRHC